jgi:hypothetical protein
MLFICDGSRCEPLLLLSSGVESSCTAAMAFKDEAKHTMTTTAEIRKMGRRKTPKQVNQGGFDRQ